MDIQAIKLNLIERLIWLSDTKTINQIDKLLNKTIKDKYEAKLKPMTGEQYKTRLENAEDDLKNNRVISQEDLEDEIKNW